ncbi:MAG: hypothetical protein IPH32_12155 [Bacteroidetes bacterium]|nr:hypothetical protein [Bacteroidota bacterium]
MSSIKIGLDEVLKFYSFGKNTAMFYNADNNKYALCLFNNNEVKKYEFDKYMRCLYSDSLRMLLKGWDTNIVFDVNFSNVSKIKIQKSLNEKIFYYEFNYDGQFDNFFKKENKMLGKYLTVCVLKSNFIIDTFSYGNIPIEVRYNLSNIFNVKFENHNLLVVDKKGDFYFADEKSHVKYLISNTNDKILLNKEMPEIFKILIFKDLLLLTKHNRLIVLKIDKLNKKLWLLNDYSFKNGLLSMYENAFFIHDNYLILNSQGIPYISIFSYNEFIKTD